MNGISQNRGLHYSLSRFYLIILFLFTLSPARSSADTSVSTYLPPPPPPVLSYVAGGKMEPHSDYIKLTYVSATGESTASAETVYSAGPNTLTVVHSPPAEPGAIGYNIYAVKNNAGSGMGQVLQTSKSLPIGIDFTEPEGGWAPSRILPPLINSALIPIPKKTVRITQSGGYFEAPVVNGAEAALVFSSADSRPTVELSLSSASGLPAGIPGPSAVSQNGAPRATVIQTIGFTFRNDVTLAGLPTFKLTLPRNVTAPAPYVLNIYDGSTGHLIVMVPGYFYRTLTFLDDFRTTFHAVASRPYYAELTVNSPTASSFVISGSRSTLKLPSADGITITANLPPSTTPLGAFSVYASDMPPSGLPPLNEPGKPGAAYYASIMLAGTASYSEPVTLVATLPQSMSAIAKNLRLAAYDSEYSESPWSIRQAPKAIDGRTITFQARLPPFLAWRQYGFALYFATGENAATLNEPKSAASQSLTGGHKPLVFVVGDSISLLTILPPSSAGCIADWGPLPNCQYSHDPRLNWPSVFAGMTGDRVINVSNLGTQTTVNSPYGESMLSMMVPQVPPDADVVVCQCGVNDLSLNHESPSTSSRAEEMTKAILARAPHAHIVYVGIRCFIGCGKAGVASWNNSYRELAARYGGAFVDLIPLAGDGASEAFPDGSHPTPETARTIASKVAQAVANLAPDK